MLAAALTVGVALGVCAIAAAVMAPISLDAIVAWVVAGAGFAVLVGSLAALGVNQRRRDRTLR